MGTSTSTAGRLLRVAAVLALTVAGTAIAAPTQAGMVYDPENDLGEVSWGGAPALNHDGDAAVLRGDRDGTFVQTRPSGGPWRHPERVAAGVTAGVTPGALTLDGRGRPTVAWLDDGVWVRTRTAAGWTRKRLLPGGGANSGFRMAGNEAGALAVAYLTSSGLHVAYRASSGRWRAAQVLTRRQVQPLSLRIAVDRRGRATVVWVQARVQGDLLRTARSGPAGTFGAALTLSSPGTRADYSPDLAVSDGGGAVVGWLQKGPDGSVGLVRTRTPDGVWRAAHVLGGSRPLVGAAPGGRAWALWTVSRTSRWALLLSRRSPGQPWSEPEVVTDTPDEPMGLDLTASPAGSALVTYTLPFPDNLRLRQLWLAHVPDVDLPASTPEAVPAGRGAAYGVAMSGSGDALLTTTSRYGPSAGRVTAALGPDPVTYLYASVLDVTGPVAGLKRPRRAFSTGGSVRASWSAVDTWSKPVDYQLRLRTAGADAGFGPWRTVAQGTAVEATRPGRPGTTYCFGVRATDAAGNLGTWSRTRCVAVPLDDRAMRRSGRWSAVDQRGAYRGTVVRTRSRGASLSTSVSTRRVALLVTRAPDAGSVAVYLDGRRLRRVSLEAPTVRTRQLVPVARFRSVHSGRLRIVVTSADRLVAVDGLATSRR